MAQQDEQFQVAACWAVSMLARMTREMLPNPDTPSVG
jgi:hypothetical protein